MSNVYKFHRIIIDKQMARKPELMNDIEEDHNKIMTLLYVTYMFRTFRLVIFIFMISYSISIFFCIVSELSHEIFDGESEDNFIGHY